MARAAIYARFSTDQQRDRSIDDQVALCRHYAEREGWSVVAVYEDRAASGASIHGRPGLQYLIAQAGEARFDLVLAESMSRIGRDQGDRADIRKRLAFAGIQLATPSDGLVSSLTDGIRAVIDSQYLEDLKVSVRRGMAGVVRDGRHAGGRAYGYRPVPGQAGVLEIVEHERDVVRRIFRDYVAGMRPREIAARLNADGVPPPRGRAWNASTINGNRARGHGILQNPLYAGRLVWNRVRMVKHPDTGRRISRVNDGSLHQSVAVPHLAIVPPEDFAAAQALKQSRAGERPALARAPRHPLSGLLRCGRCGAGLSVKDRHGGRRRVVCTAAKESGICGTRTPYYLDAIERTVIGGLKSRLADRAAIDLYLRAYNAERQRLAAESGRRRGRLEAQLQAVEGERTRTVALLVKGVLRESEGATVLDELREREAALRAELDQLDETPPVVAVHPRTLDRYLASITRLEEAIRDGLSAGGEAAATLRDLVDTVVVHPAARPAPIMVEVTGRLTHLLGPDAFPNAKFGGGSLVAEEGLEPPTRGL